MKLTWKDIITTLLVILGGSVVYAKYYSYSWALIGSWRGAVGTIAVIGLVMFLFSSFNFANRSVLNIGEMLLILAAVGLTIAGLIVTSEALFYTLAAVLGVLWLVDTARHARHSLIGGGTPSIHHHATAH